MSLASQLTLAFAAVASAINLRAKIASPTFTGTPAAPTAAAATNTTQLATTAFVTTAVSTGQLVTVDAQTTSYTLTIGDYGRAVEVTSASATTVTIPPNSSVAFPVGTIIEIAQLGAGQVTIAAGSGVAMHSAGTLVHTRVQYSSVSIRKQATDTWLLVGDLA